MQISRSNRLARDERRSLEFYGAPIREYIPIMVEREAKADLLSLLGALPLRKRMVTT